MSNLLQYFKGTSNNVKVLLEMHKITVDDLYKRYCDKLKWYSRPHLNRIINGKRSIPLKLAQDIAKQYQMNWTDFYEVPIDFVKTIDIVPCEEDDLAVKFDAQPYQFYCIPAFAKSHWAFTSMQKHKNFFGNATKAIYLIQKQPNKPTDTSILSSLNMPLYFTTKCKRSWVGRVISYSTPIGKKEPHLVISDTANQRSYPFALSDIVNIHFIDYVAARPIWVHP
jgi:hypothetical protein